jgi:transcriptional regulator with XRE-family HTH domain
MPENIPLRERRKLVRDFRENLELSLREFGRLAGISHPMLSQFETGEGGHNLSKEAWKRVLRAVEIAQAENGWKAGASKARKIANRLGVGTHEGLTREIGPQAQRFAKGLQGLIQRLQDKVPPDDAARKAWLDAELAAAIANEKAMELCSRLEGAMPGVDAKMVIYIPAKADVIVNPSNTPASGQIAGSQRARTEEPEVRLAWNPKEEAELKAAGWKEVKSE